MGSGGLGDQFEALRLLMDNSSDVFGRITPEMTFSFMSPSIERMLGWTADELIGKAVLDLVYPEDHAEIAASTALVVAGKGHSTSVTIRAVKKDGSLLWVEVNARAINNNLADRVIVIRDVTERKALEEQLKAMAMKDGLTGLSNRRAFDETLVREWDRTVRDRGQMSVLMLDVDHFKSFNDSYGHQVGDDCLRAVAAALTRLPLEEGDMISRYGGEEIAIILARADSHHAGAVAATARAMVEGLGIPHKASSVSGGVVTVSIGLATAMARLGGSAEMPNALLVAADRALYDAKNGGRNCVREALVIAATD
ncbi:diguanylate cyclase [Sphingoaurantiacus capsulatus]|uniref:diguanylate cyclase n=1 Tax=Sphingoaurantiacus capsulatus TaxID=1771310 RepID=A0ABV7XE79_9SPHN